MKISSIQVRITTKIWLPIRWTVWYLLQKCVDSDHKQSIRITSADPSTNKSSLQLQRVSDYMPTNNLPML